MPVLADSGLTPAEAEVKDWGSWQKSQIERRGVLIGQHIDLVGE